MKDQKNVWLRVDEWVEKQTEKIPIMIFDLLIITFGCIFFLVGLMIIIMESVIIGAMLIFFNYLTVMYLLLKRHPTVRKWINKN